MRRTIKYIVIAIACALGVIQFIHPKKNKTETAGTSDISQVVTVPDSVQHILAKACYDCHSDNTRYPWYNNIQPVAWWLNDHINEGKRHLNFSEFGNYKLLQQAKKLAQCAREVNEGGMPLNSYLWIHKDAILNDQEKKIFMDWCDSNSKHLYARVSPEEIAEDKRQQEERRKQKNR